MKNLKQLDYDSRGTKAEAPTPPAPPEEFDHFARRHEIRLAVIRADHRRWAEADADDEDDAGRSALDRCYAVEVSWSRSR